MTDRPILFSGPMVRAILEGRKTVTRRVLKPQPQGISAARRVRNVCYQITPESDRCTVDFKAPIYAPGDRLWVREAFSYDRLDVDCDGILPPWYWADSNPGSGDWTRPKPSIHMPRWASRLTLHVTDVRVQRLQDISEDDARAEGIEAREIRAVPERWGVPPETWWFGTEAGRRTAKAAFGDLWDSLNAERAPWARNPWVVAVTFRPELCNIDSAYGAVAKREATE